MKCTRCGASTIGWVISVQGGSRVRSIGWSRSRGIKCADCADARIAELRAQEIAKTGHTR